MQTKNKITVPGDRVIVRGAGGRHAILILHHIDTQKDIAYVGSAMESVPIGVQADDVFHFDSSLSERTGADLFDKITCIKYQNKMQSPHDEEGKITRTRRPPKGDGQ